jgi:hypothetical protein|eukprot:5202464-Prymnesium_polylepis.2
MAAQEGVQEGVRRRVWYVMGSYQRMDSYLVWVTHTHLSLCLVKKEAPKELAFCLRIYLSCSVRVTPNAASTFAFAAASRTRMPGMYLVKVETRRRTKTKEWASCASKSMGSMVRSYPPIDGIGVKFLLPIASAKSMPLPIREHALLG